MTMPEEDIILQEANANDMPPNYQPDTDIGDNDTKEQEPHMYFIAVGTCHVDV